MAASADRALSDARAQQVDLARMLGGVQDWAIVDSTTVSVRDALRVECPGTGKDVALDVDEVLSVGPEFFPGPTSMSSWRRIRVRHGRAIDADVPVGEAKHAVPLRLCWGHTPHRAMVSSCPTCRPGSGPPVQTSPACAGQFERRSRWDTSVHRLDEVDCERPCSLRTLRHASRLATMIAALLAHTHHRQTRPPQEGARFGLRRRGIPDTHDQGLLYTDGEFSGLASEYLNK